MTPLTAVTAFAEQLSSAVSEQALAKAGNVVPDIEFRKQINKILKKEPLDGAISIEDMGKLEDVIIINSDSKIQSLEGIKYAVNLKQLVSSKPDMLALEEIAPINNLIKLLIRSNTVDLS